MWRPSASIETLKQRATYIAQIRQFFIGRGVLEVETPCLSHYSVTDPFVVGIPAIFQAIGSQHQAICYLQTSPEYAMKRLLAANAGPIYQLSKSFRQGEVGRIHNPEFTLLEWYRPQYDHHALMDEMDDLLQLILQVGPAQRVTYAEVYMNKLGVNPHTATIDTLADIARARCGLSFDSLDKDGWLDILWTHLIEPMVGLNVPLFVYDFPASQASLAKVRPGNPALASRFEVYFKGTELANGFHELQNAQEQIARFDKNNAYRQAQGLPMIPIDKHLISALEHGLPESAGVALGVDRLIMLALGKTNIADILSFDFERA